MALTFYYSSVSPPYIFFTDTAARLLQTTEFPVPATLPIVYNLLKGDLGVFGVFGVFTEDSSLSKEEFFIKFTPIDEDDYFCEGEY